MEAIERTMQPDSKQQPQQQQQQQQGEAGAASERKKEKEGEKKKTENVLVLQGGGSLGAFGCGVFKALSRSGISFDLVGGTSIGAANAAIICGSRSGDPAADLEDFWLEVAQSSYSFFPDTFAVPYYDFEKRAFALKKLPTSALNSVVFGVPKMFLPRWMVPGELGPLDVLSPPSNWTHYYTHAPLAAMLEKYVDFDKLSPKGGGTRLVVTAVDVLTARTLRFDSARMHLEPKHVLASCAYSAYGFSWVEVDRGVYAWDGGLLSNTPLKEVIEASPRNNKNVYIVENYPRKIDRLPVDRSEVVDRTRDIIFSDKTIYDLRAWKHMSRQTDLIEKLYSVFEKHAAASVDESLAGEIRQQYRSLVGDYGSAEILAVYRIARRRMASPYLLKNADFSVATIKDLIRQGEQRALERLEGAADDGSMEPGELLKLLDL